MESDGPDGAEGCWGWRCGGGDSAGGADCCSSGLVAFGFLLSTITIASTTTTMIPMAPTSTIIVSGSSVVGAVVSVGCPVGWFVGLDVG